MFEVSHAGENHRETVFIGSRNDLFVAHGGRQENGAAFCPPGCKSAQHVEPALVRHPEIQDEHVRVALENRFNRAE